MNQPTRLLARLLNAAQRRYRRARPGSVLIMVVSLLVLLALIGTAAMSTARIDRVSSRQNVYNTQVELLADSLKNLIVGQLVDDIFASNGNTGQTDSSSLNPDAGRDSLADVIIGSRLPELLYPYATNSVYVNDPTPTADNVVWHGISYPPIKTSTTVPGTGTRDTVYSFSPPDEEDNTTPLVAAQYALPFYKPTLKPTFKKLNSGDIVPALLPVNVYTGGSFPDLSNSLSRGGTRPFVAGDADGDGIADSLPFKLPMSPIAGVTYYGVVRVVDNSAAININTARAPGFEVTEVMLRSSNTTSPSTSTELSLAGIYPASIDLYKYLDPTGKPGTGTNNLTELQQHTGQLLYGNRGFGEFVNSSDPSPESITLPPSDTYTDLAHPSRTTYPDAPDNKTPPPGPPANFEFLTYGDAMWHQLGRRLDYPGFVGDPTATPPGRSPVFGGELRPFGVSDAMTLASRFVLANSATTSDALVEKALFRTTFRNALSFPYKSANAVNPTQADYDKAVADWFTNFHFGRLPGSARPDSVLNGRPIFTTLNPVRNYVPGEPTLARINPNTATYEELLERYYLVMKEATDDVDQIDVAAGDTGYPYGELLFINPDDTDKRKDEQKDLPGAQWPKWKKIDNGLNDAMMFRSSLRPPTHEVKLKDTLPPNQMARLRAAIAAVNTIQLRKGLPDDKSPVEARDVNLTGTPVSGNSNPKQYTARVYGTWRQPFITEVFLHNDTNTNTNSPEAGGSARRNPRGFAAIELYNPYDVDISLEDWKIALLTRTPSSSTDALQNAYLSVSYLQKTLVGGPTPAPAAAAPPVNNDFIFPADPNCVVPARGYLILWNYEEPVAAAPADPDAATWRPGKLHMLTTTVGDPAAVKAYTIKNLHEIIGKEMVLMRPAGSVGAAGGVTEYAPVDSYDSTGMIHHVDIEPDAGLEEWHYSRASKHDNRARDNRAWHCVYPGRYDGGSNKARHQGTEVEPIVKGADEPWGLPGKHPVSGEMNLTFGTGENKNSRDFTLTDPKDVPNTFGIQLAYFDGSISFQRNSNVWTYPGGGFARIGDLLHVTYIGSYVIQDGPASGPPSSSVYEVNPVTIDAAFAEDTDPTTDAIDDDNDNTTSPRPNEDIGRFAPLLTSAAGHVDLSARIGTGIIQGGNATSIFDSGRREPATSWDGYDVVVTYKDTQNRTRKAWSTVQSHSNGTINLTDPLPTEAAKPGNSYKIQAVRYGWATKLFDHFSVLSHPGTDFLPNTGPDNTNVAGSQATKNLPDPNTAANTPEENAVPIEGLININTAPWQVLATIPWVMDTTDPQLRIPDRAACDRVAKAIVYFRDVDDGLNPVNTDPHPHGPFRSILELALVPAVREAWRVDGSTSLELYDGNNAPNVYAGDFSPLVDGESDRGGYDFERKFLNVTRVSNLLTTRSDCFTVYLQVQGWRDAGTADAKMVVQRRLAFIVDRSQVTPTKRQAKIYNIATSQ